MNEKFYRSIGSVAACDIAIGIVILVTGIAAGVLAIINGAKLLASRKNIIF